jgi:hypothetical protein
MFARRHPQKTPMVSASVVRNGRVTVPSSWQAAKHLHRPPNDWGDLGLHDSLGRSFPRRCTFGSLFSSSLRSKSASARRIFSSTCRSASPVMRTSLGERIDRSCSTSLRTAPISRCKQAICADWPCSCLQSSARGCTAEQESCPCAQIADMRLRARPDMEHPTGLECGMACSTAE